MTLQEAAKFLRGAVARGMPGGQASVYTVFNGWIYAQSPAILAAYPVPHMQGLYSLAADDLEGALARMPTEPTLDAGDGTLILRSGRLRSSIQLLEADEPSMTYDDISAENNETQDVPNGLMRGLAVTLPFVSKDGSWQRGVWIEEGRIVAINNRCGIEVALPALNPPAPSILTSDCVAYLTKLSDAPSTVRFAGSYVLFGWPNTAWIKCQAMSAEWPTKVVDNILNGADDVTPVELNADWRSSFDDVASLGDGNVELRPDGIFGKSAHAEHEAEFETGVTRTTHWSLEALKPVFACAERWNPDAQGGARFVGAGLRGVVAGRRR